MWKREDSHGKREDGHGGNFELCWAVEEVTLGGNDCPGPQELLVQDPLEESGTGRRFICSRLAATEALSPGCKWYGGRGLWGRGRSGTHPCHRYFKIVMFVGSKERTLKDCLLELFQALVWNECSHHMGGRL